MALQWPSHLFSRVQFCSVKYVHIVVQKIPRTFSSCRTAHLSSRSSLEDVRTRTRTFMFKALCSITSSMRHCDPPVLCCIVPLCWAALDKAPSDACSWSLHPCNPFPSSGSVTSKWKNMAEVLRWCLWDEATKTRWHLSVWPSPTLEEACCHGSSLADRLTWQGLRSLANSCRGPAPCSQPRRWAWETFWGLLGAMHSHEFGSIPPARQSSLQMTAAHLGHQVSEIFS